MEVAEIKGALEKTLEKLRGGDEVDEVGVEVGKALDSLAGVLETVKDVVSDGIGLDDLSALGKVVSPIMQVAAGLKDFSGAQKKRFVQESVWLLYKTVDGWPDGNHNRVNIPWVAGRIEVTLEKGILRFASGMAVDAVYDRMRDSGELVVDPAEVDVPTEDVE